MPTFDSKRGLWSPAKEDVYVDYSQSKFKKNRNRESFHHVGPDRAAAEQLKEADQEHFGMDVANDPQLMEVAQKFNMTVPQYLDKFKPTDKQVAIKEKADKRVVKHALPVAKRGVSPQGGGVTTTGALSDQMPV